ncbi:hypothetical protein CWB82_11605, partial [Pseudoalteromonas sp. S1690]
MLAGVLKAMLLRIYLFIYLSIYLFTYLPNCASKLHAYVDFILGVSWVVCVLLAGALKATLLHI